MAKLLPHGTDLSGCCLLGSILAYSYRALRLYLQVTLLPAGCAASLMVVLSPTYLVGVTLSPCLSEMALSPCLSEMTLSHCLAEMMLSTCLSGMT